MERRASGRVAPFRQKWPRGVCAVYGENNMGEYNITLWDRRPRWLDVGWYKYLFRLPERLYDRPLGWKYNNHTLDYFSRVWCRLRGHPAGQVYYSNGLEPDTRCRDCGDDI